jgi:hypothetical protein
MCVSKTPDMVQFPELFTHNHSRELHLGMMEKCVNAGSHEESCPLVDIQNTLGF